MSIPVRSAVPAILPLAEAARDAEAALRGDHDAPTLTTALKQLVATARAQFTITHDGDPIATAHGYQAARSIARLMSADAGGQFTAQPPSGSAHAAETFIQGIPAAQYGNGTQR